MSLYKLVILANAAIGRDDEFNEWYSNRHLDDVLDIAEFKSAQRFELAAVQRSPDASPYRYLAIYDVETDNPQAVFNELTARREDGRMVVSDAGDPKTFSYLFRPITPIRKPASPSADQFGFPTFSEARHGQLTVISDALEFPEGPVAMSDGSVIVAEVKGGTLTRVTLTGEIVRIARLGGSPNGAAIGPDGACYVCNSGGFGWHQDSRWGWRGHGAAAEYTGGRIERVDLNTGEARVLYNKDDHGHLHAPNDLVFDRQGGFWFTDSGKVRADDRDHGAIYYAQPDGSMIRRVIYPFIHPHPNGIALSPKEDVLYVVETATGRIWSFEITKPGEVKRLPFPSPNGGRLVAGLPGYKLLDSMAVDGAGNLCIATVIDSGITVLSPQGHQIDFVPLPDLIPTNICFGGSDLRTAFITLSASGRLVSIDWPRSGLPLNFRR